MSESKEPTKKAMSAVIEAIKEDIDSGAYPIKRIATAEELKLTKEILSAIRRLIEHGPEVTSQWVNTLAVNLIMAVPKVRGKDLARTVLHGMVVKEIKEALREDGVKVKEVGNG